jgi:hypothetical protein
VWLFFLLVMIVQLVELKEEQCQAARVQLG